MKRIYLLAFAATALVLLSGVRVRAAESVTLMYPANDTTLYCPSPQILLQWKSTVETSTLTTYHIQVSTDSNFTSFPLFIDDVVLGPGNVVTKATLPVQTMARTLYWRVTSSSTTNWSRVWRINAVVSAPTEPTDLSPADGSSYCRKATLSWTNPVGTKSVNLRFYWWTANGSLAGFVSGDEGLRSSEIVNRLDRNVVYYWTVTVEDSAGNRHTSGARKLSLFLPAPVTLLEPQNASKISEVDSVILLRWMRNPDANLYIVSLAGPSTYQRLDTVTGSNLRISKAGLQIGDYAWRVRCMCDSTSGGDYTTPFGFSIVLLADDVHDDARTSSVHCSPNPIRHTARIVFPPNSSAVAYAYIVNECGSVVYRCTSDEVLQGKLIWSPDSLSQAAGPYFFMVYDGNKLYHSTLAVEKD